MLAACSSYSSSGGTPDAGATDGATPPADGGDDAGAAPNLLVNGGFEQGCAGWAANGFATTTADGTARTGAGSCRLCYVGDGGFGTNANLFQPVMHALPATSRPLATFWVRTPPGTSPSTNVYARVTIELQDGGVSLCDSAGHFAPGETWQRIDATCTQALDGVGIDVDLVTDTACVLVDDASLVLE